MAQEVRGFKIFKGGFMRDALVFASQNQLDFQETRANVIRIPEVVMRIREAQKIWDSLDLGSLDLATFIASDDAIFLGNIRLKTFATAVVQIGLLDRYLKRNELPEFVLGTVNGDSPLKVVTGEMSFFELVCESAAQTTPRKVPSPDKLAESGGLPILAGVQLAKFSAYKFNVENGSFGVVKADATQVEKLIETLASEFNLQSLIVIGPGNSVFKTSQAFKVRDSISMDPALSWFWGHQEPRLRAVN